jgi:hypothetical protein
MDSKASREMDKNARRVESSRRVLEHKKLTTECICFIFG